MQQLNAGAVALDHRDLPRHPRPVLHQHGVKELGDVRRGEGEHLLDLGTPVQTEPQVPAIHKALVHSGISKIKSAIAKQSCITSTCKFSVSLVCPRYGKS